MRTHDFSSFKVWCSEIYGLLSRPKGCSKPPQKDVKRYEKLLCSDEIKEEADVEFITKYDDRVAMYNDPPLSKTTISALVRQYGWHVYNKKVAQKGDALSFLKKGTDMESEAVELLSKIDKKQYSLITETTENDYLVGRCDILAEEMSKVIDVKISWNVNAFLKARTSPISNKYWYQMQGYMELYNVNFSEVVFLLLNTPPDLIEREKMKLINRFMIGEIDREKYELDMENIESAFTYSNLPLKRRYLRYTIKREPEIFDYIYKRVEKSRIWLSEFEHEMKKNIFIVPSDKYIESGKNNSESDPTEPLSSDEG